jgi:hypothetical protein
MQIQDCQEEKIAMYRLLLKGLIELLESTSSPSEKEALKYRITEVGVRLQSLLSVDIRA